jgi:hypothetical protein
MKSKRYAKEGKTDWLPVICEDCGEKFKSDVISVYRQIRPVWCWCYECNKIRKEEENEGDNRERKNKMGNNAGTSQDPD